MSDQTLSPTVGQRVVVIGTTGSGKTTLAAQLAVRFGCPHIELDSLHWDPDWQEAPLPVFRDRISQALLAPAWVVDGNYGKVRDLVWSQADSLIWLDYSLPVIILRLLRRTLQRLLTHEELWNGNRESFRTTFLSRDSILWWALTTYNRRRKSYPELFRKPEHAHLTVIRLLSPQATRAWLRTVESREG